jgi:hypothetical protein
MVAKLAFGKRLLAAVVVADTTAVAVAVTTVAVPGLTVVVVVALAHL